MNEEVCFAVWTQLRLCRINEARNPSWLSAGHVVSYIMFPVLGHMDASLQGQWDQNGDRNKVRRGQGSDMREKGRTDKER